MLIDSRWSYEYNPFLFPLHQSESIRGLALSLADYSQAIPFARMLWEILFVVLVGLFWTQDYILWGLRTSYVFWIWVRAGFDDGIFVVAGEEDSDDDDREV